MFLIICFSIAMMMTFWFKTEVFVEYVCLFRLQRLFYVQEYKSMKEQDPGYAYLEHLAYHHDCFFTRLITCPICLSTWLSAFSLFFTSIPLFLPTAFVSLSLYLFLVRLIGNDKSGPEQDN